MRPGATKLSRSSRQRLRASARDWRESHDGAIARLSASGALHRVADVKPNQQHTRNRDHQNEERRAHTIQNGRIERHQRDSGKEA